MPDIPLMTRQARGKIRRFLQVQFRKQQVDAFVAQRQGACNRCGACCKILFRCPFLTEDAEGNAKCRIYAYRFEQCRYYPIQPRDMQEVQSCSYTFAPQPEESPVVCDAPAGAPPPLTA
jgi:uncharacterized cysteine cluster protein YcgN (CxxCxxCC family)